MKYRNARFSVPVQVDVSQERWDEIFGSDDAPAKRPSDRRPIAEYRRGNLSDERHLLPHQRTREVNRKAQNQRGPHERGRPLVVFDVSQERWDEIFGDDNLGDPLADPRG